MQKGTHTTGQIPVVSGSSRFYHPVYSELRLAPKSELEIPALMNAIRLLNFLQVGKNFRFELRQNFRGHVFQRVARAVRPFGLVMPPRS